MDQSDLLYGYAAIGQHLDVTRRQAEHLATKAGLPTFKLGRTVCARRSALEAHFLALQEAANGDRR